MTNGIVCLRNIQWYDLTATTSSGAFQAVVNVCIEITFKVYENTVLIYFQAYWKDKFLYAFQNLRRRRDNNHSEVKDHKRNSSGKPGGGNGGNKKEDEGCRNRVEYGFSNYRPMHRPDSETAASVEAHQKVYNCYYPEYKS